MVSLDTKEKVLTFLAVVIIYLGVYTLRSSEVPSKSSTTAQWAGFFAITLGVFTLLTLLFSTPVATSNAGFLGFKDKYNTIFLVVLGVSFLASAYFNYKLLANGVNGDPLKWALWGQIAAHVALLVAFFVEFGSKPKPVAHTNPLTGLTTPLPLSTPMQVTSPRRPVRV